MPTDATRRAALRSGPDREELPSLWLPLLSGSLNLCSVIIAIVLLIATGGLSHLMWLVINGAFVIQARWSWGIRIKERAEVRERNYETVDDFYDRHDILWLEPPSPELQERDDQWEADYAAIMAAKGLLPNGDPLPKVSNRAKKRQTRKGRSEEIQKALTHARNTIKQRPEGYAKRSVAGSFFSHDFHCDDPAGPCTCSDNCRCAVCMGHSY